MTPQRAVAGAPARAVAELRRVPARSRTADAHRYWYPLVALVRRDVQKRYASTLLGASWTVLQPLVLLAVYVTVFAFLLPDGRGGGSGARPYVFAILAGMLPYLAIAEGLQRASSALRDDRALLDRVEFPAEVVPAARVLGASLNEIIALAALVAIGPWLGLALSGWIAMLPLLVAARIVLTTGLAWVISILAIFVADLGEVLTLLLTAWLFLTPVFYGADAVPAALQWLLALNPLYHLVEAYRAVLIDGRAPLPEGLFVVGWAAAVFALGLWFFRATLDRGKDLL